MKLHAKREQVPGNLAPPDFPKGMLGGTSLARSRPARAVGVAALGLRGWLGLWLVLVLALLPRVLGLRGFVTVDEAMHWQGRVAAFSAALAEGRFADTLLAGHPGVTTLWLGSLGLALERLLQGMGWLGAPDYQGHLALLRLPVALATALGPALGLLLLRRVFDARAAMLAACFWAADPFLVAHSRLLHLDALLTTFMTLGLLGLLAAFFDHNGARARPALPLLALAGLVFGLALLTKVPSIMLLPLAAMIAAAWVWQRPGPLRQRLGLAGGGLVLWLLVALGLAFLLWPALWVAPLAALGRMLRETIDNGESPHGWGNFFMGQALADPGPWFYPAVLALRTTPWTLLGLLAGISCWLLRFGRKPRSDMTSFGLCSLLLTLFVVLFMLLMGLAAKKFDRYLLPVFPALDVLAALGLLALFDVGRRRLFNAGRTQPVLFGATLLVLSANLFWYQPYYLAYYNPLLGGGSVAARILPVGWGEGMDLAAEWLNQQPDIQDGAVASWFEFTLAPYVDGKVFSVGYLRRGREFFNYLVIYVDQVQRRNEPTIIDAYLGRRTPLHVVRIHGIDYAWIYQIPPSVQQPSQARFGEHVQLLGSTIEARDLRAGQPLRLTLALGSDAPSNEQPLLFVHVLGPDGRRYAQADAAAGDPRFAGWQPGRYATRSLSLPLPADAPAGRYRVVMGLYQPGAAARLALRDAVPLDPALDGEQALLLGTFELP